MSVNSSNSSINPSECKNGHIQAYINVSFALVHITPVLPLSVTVLILGFQRWKQKRSVSSAASVSFSDFFTYNMAALELIGISGRIITFSAIITNLPVLSSVGLIATVFTWNGQMFFPIFTSVDRYLAVVHPITYLGLKQRRGVCIRNVCTICVWLMCCAGVASLPFVLNSPEHGLITSLCVTVILLLALTFCSLSVLRILIRPRPGEAGGDRARVDQSKQRAFNAILIIMAVLMLRFGGTLVCSALLTSPSVSVSVRCVVSEFATLFHLPSSLVLPLQFLHKEGKLTGCRHHSG